MQMIALEPPGNVARDLALFRRGLFAGLGEGSALAFPETIPLAFAAQDDGIEPRELDACGTASKDPSHRRLSSYREAFCTSRWEGPWRPSARARPTRFARARLPIPIRPSRRAWESFSASRPIRPSPSPWPSESGRPRYPFAIARSFSSSCAWARIPLRPSSGGNSPDPSAARASARTRRSPCRGPTPWTCAAPDRRRRSCRRGRRNRDTRLCRRRASG